MVFYSIDIVLEVFVLSAFSSMRRVILSSRLGFIPFARSSSLVRPELSCLRTLSRSL